MNWCVLYEKVLNYDYLEFFIGDIKMFVKYVMIEFCEMFLEVEESMIKNFIE